MAHPLGSTNTLELENGTICSVQENGGVVDKNEEHCKCPLSGSL